jgi:hypothetical protein
MCAVVRLRALMARQAVQLITNPPIEIIKWVKKFAVAQAKVTHILRPGKASEKTPKGVIPPSLCEISQNASREKKKVLLTYKV